MNAGHATYKWIYCCVKRQFCSLSPIIKYACEELEKEDVISLYNRPYVRRHIFLPLNPQEHP